MQQLQRTLQERQREVREQEQIAEAKRSSLQAARSRQEALANSRKLQDHLAAMPCRLVRTELVPASDDRGGQEELWTWSFGLSVQAVCRYSSAAKGPHRVTLSLMEDTTAGAPCTLGKQKFCGITILTSVLHTVDAPFARCEAHSQVCACTMWSLHINSVPHLLQALQTIAPR